jgi:hypothetical protein
MKVWLYKGKKAKIFDKSVTEKMAKDGWRDAPYKVSAGQVEGSKNVKRGRPKGK